MTVDFCVIGGGIAGLTIARALARGGARVALVERGEAGTGAGFVAAGMLAPLVEARLEERDVVGFGYEALRYYRTFIDELEGETGRGVGYRDEGTLIVATDRDQAGLLRHHFEEQQQLGLPVQWMNGYECRVQEPCLAPGIPGGIFSPEDRQLDNRALLAALRTFCLRHPCVSLVEHAADVRIEAPGEVRVGESVIGAERIVLATGAHADLLGPWAPRLARTIRPVKGQILRLDGSAMPLLSHVVRTPEVYLVPKANGALVVGASSEDRGFDESITAGALYELLRAAWECLPGIYELPVLETRAGFRPATPDHAPLLGEVGAHRLVLAMGYYRHGILFSPYAASLLAAWMLGGERSRWLDTFSPERFHETHAERSLT
ncbi:MAG: glycine oxidase ThiO [Bacteroidetes bacterium]|nr:glycine oxidase ThiO [Bacteroidota bacterium]